jgi:flavin reductase (DIM6/NTAB) family NADH-FMN oxidoreductase RutF
MQIDAASTPVPELYQFLTSVVNPRPIAWITTINPKGIVNLAPFSFFNLFSASPPLVIFSPTLKRDGTKKDTLRNLETCPEFVVNISTYPHAELINLTSRELAPDESEVELAQLHTTASAFIQPPRLQEAPAALECRVRQIIPLGTGPIAGNLVLGDVLTVHVQDAILGEDGKPDPQKLQTVGRMGGEFWCKTTDLFSLRRP